MKLTQREEEIMQIVWRLGRAFPRQIMDLMKKPIPPYNTTLSMIRKLETNAWLGFKKIGKSHEYFPLIQKKEYSKSLFKNLYKEYFGSSKELLMSYFMKEEEIDIEELEELVKEMKNNTK